ncbi:MAG: DNRLRE domain-containing protein, partial [Candidatus Limnocylindrales bacterium]
MSQQKTWAASASTVTRTTDSTTTSGDGAGHNVRLYAGREGATGSKRNYRSYLLFTLDWTGVGSITSAVLSLYNDDYLGGTLTDHSVTAQKPTIEVQRLTASATYGTNADEHFDATDFTHPAATTTGEVGKVMNKAHDLVTDIDITAIVKAWAPASVVGGGKQTNHGLLIRGNTTLKQAWSGWSHYASDSSKRPVITLTYELGATPPNVPTNLSPSGDEASIGAFQADFSDDVTTDVLAASAVQVYASTAPTAGTATASTDLVNATAHGLNAGAEVWFHSLTGGVGLSTAVPYYVLASGLTANAFKVSLTPTGAAVDITTNYSALTFGSPVISFNKPASNTEQVNARSNLVPDNYQPVVGRAYQWRIRQHDQGGL